MAEQYLINQSSLEDIAAAIKDKSGDNTPLYPSEMAAAIRNISGGGAIYTAGENIQISDDNVISATDTTYAAGTNINISDDNVISASINLSDYATKDELATKQDALTSGVNIKTINSEDILGEGNLEIGGSKVTMEDNLDKTVRFSVDDTTKDVASNVNLIELQNHVEQGYTSDPNVIIGHRYDAKTGNLIEYSRACCSRQKYAFGPGVAITMNTNGSNEYTGYCEYDADGNFLRGHNSAHNPSTWTTGADCALVAFNFDGYTKYTGKATYIDEIGQTVEIIKVDLGTYHKGLNDKADKTDTETRLSALETNIPFKFISLTKEEYDALETKDSSTVYLIGE